MKLFSVLFIVFAGFSANAADLKDAELVYTKLSQSFPDSVQFSGGLSTMIEAKEILCSFSNARSAQGPIVLKKCHMVTGENAIVHATGDVSDLIFALLNSGGMKIDTTSESGTTYLSATGLDCLSQECKSSNPQVCTGKPAVYSCTVD